MKVKGHGPWGYSSTVLYISHGGFTCCSDKWGWSYSTIRSCSLCVFLFSHMTCQNCFLWCCSLKHKKGFSKHLRKDEYLNVAFVSCRDSKYSKTHIIQYTLTCTDRAYCCWCDRWYTGRQQQHRTYKIHFFFSGCFNMSNRPNPNTFCRSCSV